MRTRRRWILPLPLLALLLAATVASAGPAAEEVRIAGCVVDDVTGRPLAGVQVFLREVHDVGALTDADGRYLLVVPHARLPRGDVHVVAALIGYASAESAVPVPTDGADHPLTVDFRLQSRPFALDELVVTGAAGTPGRPTAPPPSVTYDARSATPVARPHAPPPPAADATGGSSAPGEIIFYGTPGRPVDPRWRERPRLPRRPYGGDREQYAYIAENPYRSAEDEPLSTFSIDVDRASYSNARRFLLREGRLPPVDAVQIEEMVNYFSYDYALPRGRDPLAVTTEVAAAPWAPEHRLLRVGLASRPVATEDTPPANLVFLLDVSGSMASADKLPLVKASLRLLVDRLRPVDRVAIVVYAGAAGLVLEPTSGMRRDVILDAIERLQAGGSTAGGEGLRLAYHVARTGFHRGGNNRVILATDGDFNVGESSDAAMVRLIEEKRREGTFLTVLGFGTGNLQSEKMQELAQHGNGNYAYIDGLREAQKVLVREMGGTLLTVARDVKVQIEFNPARVRAYRLLGYENRLLAAEDFNDDAKDAGEVGAGHTVTALYEIVPADSDDDVRTGTVDPLRYRGPERRTRRGDGDELAFVKVRYKRPEGGESRLLSTPVLGRRTPVSTDFTFAAAVAGFGMLLRASEYRGSLTAEQVLALAADGLGEDPDGDRRGFLELVRAYCGLGGRDGG